MATTTTVNGKRLETTALTSAVEEAAARRLLAYDDAADRVNVTPVGTIKVWVQGVSTLNWRPPAGYRIESLSVFRGSPTTEASVCVSLEATEVN